MSLALPIKCAKTLGESACGANSLQSATLDMLIMHAGDSKKVMQVYNYVLIVSYMPMHGQCACHTPAGDRLQAWQAWQYTKLV
jgi:hypothetical protein